MSLVLQVVAVALLMVPVGYAHWHLADFTRGAGRVAATRVFLLLVGMGFGWVVSAGLATGWKRGLFMLIGFGAVHVPAAVILFIKSRRGADRS